MFWSNKLNSLALDQLALVIFLKSLRAHPILNFPNLVALRLIVLAHFVIQSIRVVGLIEMLIDWQKLFGLFAHSIELIARKPRMTNRHIALRYNPERALNDVLNKQRDKAQLRS